MGRREANKEDKRRRLLDAGLAAFREQGFAGASVERVASDADVARGTFYLYFPDKEALFRALVERLYDPLEGAVGDARAALADCPDAASTYPVYAALGLRLAEVLALHPEEVRLHFAEGRAPGAGGEIVRAHAARLESLTRDILEDAVAHGTLRAHDTYAVALAIVGGIERLVWAWLRGEVLDVAGLPAEVTRLFRHGLAP